MGSVALETEAAVSASSATTPLRVSDAPAAETETRITPAVSACSAPSASHGTPMEVGATPAAEGPATLHLRIAAPASG